MKTTQNIETYTDYNRFHLGDEKNSETAFLAERANFFYTADYLVSGKVLVFREGGKKYYVFEHDALGIVTKGKSLHELFSNASRAVRLAMKDAG